jgi:endonuclease G, mitochondrial
MKKFVVALLFLWPIFVQSQQNCQIVSIASGDWNNPAIWSCNCIPKSSDNVLIKMGHTIRVTHSMGAQGCRNLNVETGAVFEMMGVFSSNPINHLLLGNPSNATTNVTDTSNFLMVKHQYALSYNKTKRHANWVSWELSKMWMGDVDRQDDFRPDNTLPLDWYKALPSDYTNSGFDRGHLCPSADRTKTDNDNSATFLMTNIIPQAPKLNRESWAYLENYCRDVVKSGYEATIIAGAIGSGGSGDNGTATSVKNNVNVPATIYKIIVFHPEGACFTADSPVIAVSFPNTNAATNTNWFNYITTPAAIEQATGHAFFNNLPEPLRLALKSKRFDFANSSLDVDAIVGLYNGRQLYVGPRGGCYYINSNGNKSYVDRSFCGTN